VSAAAAVAQHRELITIAPVRFVASAPIVGSAVQRGDCAPVRPSAGELLVACALEGLDHADVVAVAVTANLVGATAEEPVRSTPDEVLSKAVASLLGTTPTNAITAELGFRAAMITPPSAPSSVYASSHHSGRLVDKPVGS
jgi:hypothetical protein